MDEERMITIPLICKENSDLRFIKIIKWLVALLIVSNLVWGGSWIAYWIIPQSDENVTQESDGDGVNNYIGNDGDISR